MLREFLCRLGGLSRGSLGSRFLSSPFVIRVPFFLLLGFNKGTLD